MSLNTVAVIGAGQMGQGIAQTFAMAGYRVILNDIDTVTIEKGIDTLSSSLSELYDKDLLEERPEVIRDRIVGSNDFSALTHAFLVVEAASENEQLKRKIFTQLDKLCPDNTILATNTSSLSITRLASATQRPSQVIGLHFMHPVPLIPLVEVVKGLQTSDVTYRTMLGIVDRLNKSAISSEDRPGFVVNRILVPMINEAIFTLYEGVASAEDIDKAMTIGAAFPIGPLTLADMMGLDTCLHMMQVLSAGYSDNKYRPCPLLIQMVDAGYLGRKTERGFFHY